MPTLRNRWRAFWQVHDPDDVFAYSTFKLVLIRDRYLGFLHYIFQFCILLYILIYVLLIEKEYLDRSPAVGVVKLDVSSGVTPGDYDSNAFKYCSPPGTSNSTLPVCVFPATEQFTDELGSSIFISTQINVYKYSSGPDCSSTNNPYCTPQLLANATYMVGNVYDFKVTLDHSATVDFGNTAPKGYLKTEKDPNSWKNCEDCSKFFFQSFSADEIPMSDLLKAAQVNLDDDATNYLQGTANYPGPLTRRQFGVVIFLDIEYDNVAEYYTKKSKRAIRYYYKPSLVDDVDDSNTITAYTEYPNNRTVITSRGIRIIGAISGEIGIFKFQVLLIQLTSALALIKVATTIVDLIAIYLLPRKSQYKNAKYQMTEDFSDIAKKEREAQRLKDLTKPSRQPGDDDSADGNSITLEESPSSYSV
eukprot:TRINITY_DN7116_c0_g1_i2.p1 TRINITY_DN7116_c0_g1~~TRINITY_DN7116_c0_g1_i2.p1  ORF type:complete len:418 (-),score=74.27 TRINITY_DN7116_c0_g1_i2:19-1272(-)